MALTAGPVPLRSAYSRVLLSLQRPRTSWSLTVPDSSYQLQRETRTMVRSWGADEHWLEALWPQPQPSYSRVDEHLVPGSLPDSSRCTDFGRGFLGFDLGLPSPCSSRICCCFRRKYSCFMSSLRAFSSSFRIRSSSALRLRKIVDMLVKGTSGHSSRLWQCSNVQQAPLCLSTQDSHCRAEAALGA